MATQRRCGLIACDRSTRLCLGSSRPIGTGRFCLKSLSTLRKRAWRICACHGTVMDQSSNQEAAVCRANSAASQREKGISLCDSGVSRFALSSISSKHFQGRLRRPLCQRPGLVRAMWGRSCGPSHHFCSSGFLAPLFRWFFTTLQTQAHGFREFRTSFRIVRSHHRVIWREVPKCAVFLRGHVVARAQVALQRFVFFSVKE